MARGAKGRNRTADTGIFSAVLYRLSYLGVGWLGTSAGKCIIGTWQCQPSALHTAMADFSVTAGGQATIIAEKL